MKKKKTVKIISYWRRDYAWNCGVYCSGHNIMWRERGGRIIIALDVYTGYFCNISLVLYIIVIKILYCIVSDGRFYDKIIIGRNSNARNNNSDKLVFRAECIVRSVTSYLVCCMHCYDAAMQVCRYASSRLHWSHGTDYYIIIILFPVIGELISFHQFNCSVEQQQLLKLYWNRTTTHTHTNGVKIAHVNHDIIYGEAENQWKRFRVNHAHTIFYGRVVVMFLAGFKYIHPDSLVVAEPKIPPSLSRDESAIFKTYKHIHGP